MTTVQSTPSVDMHKHGLTANQLKLCHLYLSLYVAHAHFNPTKITVCVNTMKHGVFTFYVFHLLDKTPPTKSLNPTHEGARRTEFVYRHVGNRPLAPALQVHRTMATHQPVSAVTKARRVTAIKVQGIQQRERHRNIRGLERPLYNNNKLLFQDGEC